MKLMKKIAAVLLALMILLTGCHIASDTTWALEHDGERLPSGAYIMFMNQALIDALDILHREWMAWEPAYDGDTSLPTHPEDVESGREMLDLIIDGMRLYDWLINEAQDRARQHFAVQHKMNELGITVDPEELEFSAMNSSMVYQAQADDFRAIGVAESSLILVNQSAIAFNTLFFEMYEPGGAYEVPEQEIRDYLSENFIRGHILNIWKPWPLSRGNFETDQAYDEATQARDAQISEFRQLAQSTLERLRAGEDVAQLQYEMDMITRGTAAMSDPETFDILARRDEDHTFATAIEGLIGMSVGQAGVFEDDNMITIARRLDVFDGEEALESVRDDILYSLRFDDHFMPMLEELGHTTLSIRVNNAAIRRYRPSMLVN